MTYVMHSSHQAATQDVSTDATHPPHLSDRVLPRARWFAPGVVKMQRSIDPTGHGLFATRPFRKNEPIGRFGGCLVPAAEIDAYVAKVGKFGHQVHADWYVCPRNGDDIAARGAINHSCAPNVGLSDSLTLVAMCDIQASAEDPVELLTDYAITGSPANGFSGCNCGTPDCLGTITREDWRIPELQDRYHSFFPPFKQRAMRPGSETPCPLIDALDSLPKTPRAPVNLASAYDAIVFDAMGVLISEDGAMPGAVDLLARLNMVGQPYYVATNISSGSDAAILERLQGTGLPIPSAHHIVSAGGVTRRIVQADLEHGRSVAVLGAALSIQQVFGQHKGLVAAHTAEHFDTLVVLDEDGFDFKHAADRILSVFYRALRNGDPLPRIIVANSDLMFPGRAIPLVFGPGVILPMITAGLAAFGVTRLDHEVIGKPGSAIFEECARRADTRNLLMVGDQIATDIAGAHAAGLDAVLLDTGLNRAEDLARAPEHQSTLVAHKLDQLLDGSLMAQDQTARC